MDTKFINIVTLCNLLQISKSTVYKWVHFRKISFYKPPKTKFLLFRLSEVIEFLERGKSESINKISTDYLNSLNSDALNN